MIRRYWLSLLGALALAFVVGGSAGVVQTKAAQGQSKGDCCKQALACCKGDRACCGKKAA